MAAFLFEFYRSSPKSQSPNAGTRDEKPKGRAVTKIARTAVDGSDSWQIIHDIAHARARKYHTKKGNVRIKL